MNFEIIILAAGKGTRMSRPDLPKVLVEFRNKPMIKHLLDELESLKMAQPPIVVVGYKYDLVQKALGPGYRYVFQNGQLGTAHAVASAKNYSKTDQVLVLYGDMPFIKAESIKALASSHRAGQNTLTMFTSKIPNYVGPLAVYSGYGRILRNNKGEIEGIREFLDASEAERQILEVNPGIYMFDSAWLWPNIDRVQPKNKQSEYYLTDMVELARKDGKKINTLDIHHHEVYGINNQANLEHADLIFDKQP